METHRDTLMGGMFSGLILWILLIIGVVHKLVTALKKTLIRGI